MLHVLKKVKRSFSTQQLNKPYRRQRMALHLRYDGDKLREGFLAVEAYQGLIKNYSKPFTDENHDALNENDYVMVRYNGDQIEPITG